MARDGVEGFEYRAARDPEGGLNVALFTPDALISERPLYQQHWLCETRPDQVCFFSGEGDAVHTYPLDAYRVDGHLPEPAL